MRWASSRSRACATTRELFLEILDEPRFGSGRYTTAYLDDARGALPSLAEQVA